MFKDNSSQFCLISAHPANRGTNYLFVPYYLYLDICVANSPAQGRFVYSLALQKQCFPPRQRQGSLIYHHYKRFGFPKLGSLFFLSNPLQSLVPCHCQVTLWEQSSRESARENNNNFSTLIVLSNNLTFVPSLEPPIFCQHLGNCSKLFVIM